jgi:ABC-type transport system involved in multi-copper enzyme maturation permease subunit
MEITGVCIALGLCSMLLGLLVSTLLTSEEQAMPALVGMTMVLVVLSGALPLESKGLVAQLSKFVPSHWATNALSASVDIIQLGLVTDKNQQENWESSIANLTMSLGYIAFFGLLFTIFGLLNLRRSR